MLNCKKGKIAEDFPCRLSYRACRTDYVGEKIPFSVEKQRNQGQNTEKYRAEKSTLKTPQQSLRCS